MKSKLSCEDVITIFERLKKEAVKYADAGEYESAVNYIRLAAQWAYTLNFKYFDKDLEDLIKTISAATLPQAILSGNAKRFVFIDTLGIDNRGLTQQYLRAMMALNVELLYISVEGKQEQYHDILYELETYGKASVIKGEEVEASCSVDKSVKLIEEIKKFNPSRIFIHLMPWDVISLLVINAIKGALKYNINLTDHAFWLGASFIDYNFEFRSFGRTISLEKRGLKDNQLLYLPYYPIFPKVEIPFQGFPEQSADCIKIFTGGSFYKMFGKGGKFFKIMDSLLSLSPKVIILVAGSGDMKLFMESIHSLTNKDRVYYIGNRKDINEVFRHCDIYLDTYPLNGGLMEQFACVNAKPLLIYSDFNVPVIEKSQTGEIPHVYSKIEDFLHYAKRLILNDDYRRNEGRRNIQFVYDEGAFNTRFEQILANAEETRSSWNDVEIDYDCWRSLYLEIENDFLHSGVKAIVSNIKLNVFKLFPQYAVIFLKSFATLISNKIIKTIFWRRLN